MFDGSFLSTPYRIDRKLYKYYSLEHIGFAIDSIINRRIHLDDPIKFNDPFDARFLIRHYTIMETGDDVYDERFQILKYLASDPQIHSNPWISKCINYIASIDLHSIPFQSGMPAISFLEGLHNLLTDSSGFSFDDFCDSIDRGFSVSDGIKKLACRISCFSEVNNSILMWSYYADNHKGICIEYDPSKLDKKHELNQQIVNSLSKVHYSPIRADNLLTYDDESILNFLLTKADVWSHEHEWRIICDEKEEYLPFDCISGIYLGARCQFQSKKIQKLFDAVSTYDHLPIYQCKLNPDRYQIDTELSYEGQINVCARRYGHN